MTESPQGQREQNRSRPATTALVAAGVTVLVLAAVVAVVALVVVLGRYGDLEDDVAEREAELVQARETAYDTAVRMSTYSFESVERDFAWFDDATTAGFRETFGPSIADSKEASVEFRIQANAEVGRIAAERNDDGTVTVLVFVDQSIKTGSEEPRLALARLELTMVEQDDEWLVDDAQLHNPGQL